MRRFKEHSRSLGAAIACIALLLYAVSPFLHGLIHADHEIQAVMDAGKDGGVPDKAPVDQDCALFKLYAGQGAHLLAVPAASVLDAPTPQAHAPFIRIGPLPAGAPRGFALGRGPPQIA